MNPLNIEIGPEAMLLITPKQRRYAVALWERGKGVRIWNDDGTLRWQTGDGEKGEL